MQPVELRRSVDNLIEKAFEGTGVKPFCKFETSSGQVGRTGIFDWRLITRKNLWFLPETINDVARISPEQNERGEAFADGNYTDLTIYIKDKNFMGNAVAFKTLYEKMYGRRVRISYNHSH